MELTTGPTIRPISRLFYGIACSNHWRDNYIQGDESWTSFDYNHGTAFQNGPQSWTLSDRIGLSFRGAKFDTSNTRSVNHNRRLKLIRFGTHPKADFIRKLILHLWCPRPIRPLKSLQFAAGQSCIRQLAFPAQQREVLSIFCWMIFTMVKEGQRNRITHLAAVKHAAIIHAAKCMLRGFFPWLYIQLCTLHMKWPEMVK